jgi:hypothetical protein
MLVVVWLVVLLVVSVVWDGRGKGVWAPTL